MIKARPGEQLVFQVVGWPFGCGVTAGQVEVRLPGPGDASQDPAGPGWLGADQLVCLNTQRTDWNGLSQHVPLQLAKGTVQPLWFPVEVPRTAGQTTVMLVVRCGQFVSEPLPVTITATGEPIADHGDSDPQGLSRLRWLNSTTAVDDELVKGYTPLVVKGRTISCLGRDLELGADGLPVQIRSYFNKAVTKVMDQPTLELLKRPLRARKVLAWAHFGVKEAEFIGWWGKEAANLHASLERSLPENAGSVSARLWQDGHDEGQQWGPGPGLALVWPDGRTLRANIRQDGRLAVAASGNENQVSPRAYA